LIRRGPSSSFFSLTGSGTGFFADAAASCASSNAWSCSMRVRTTSLPASRFARWRGLAAIAMLSTQPPHPSTRREEGKRTPSKTQRLREVVVRHGRRLRDGKTFFLRQPRIVVADDPILQLLPHGEIAPLVQRFLDI